MSKDKLLVQGAQFATGLTMKKGLELAFDYGLYPLALVTFGYLWGGILMTVIAVVLNFAIIRAYDWAQVDWLMIEALKSVKEKDANMLPRYLRWSVPLLQKSDVAAFFILCLDDPVTAVLYLRKGSYQYNGMSKRDWWIFAGANAVANLYWITGLVAVIEAFSFASILTASI